MVTRQFPNESSAELLDNGIIIYRLPMKMMLGSRYDTLVNVGFLLSNFMNKLFSESDIVYVPGNWFSVIPIAKIHKKPVLVHSHNYLLACPTSLMYNFAERRIGVSSLRSFILHEMVERCRGSLSVVSSSFLNESLGKCYKILGTFADAIVFVSNAQRDLVLSEVPSIKEKSYVIYNPIPSDPLVLAEDKGVGFFGGRRYIKGFSVLLAALGSLKCDSVEAYLTMTAGQHRTANMDNGVHLNFLPKLDFNNFLGIMRKLSVVTVPSIWPEPLPYTVIESMLRGKLVVASRIGGIPEILNGRNLGVKIIEPADIIGITDALESFLNLELEEINESGIKNREYIIGKFDNKKAVKLLTNALENSVLKS